MNLTTSLNSLPNHKLINFNVPNYLITNFDKLMKFKRISRTSMLIHLMENYIRTEISNIEIDNNLNRVISDVGVRGQNIPHKEMISKTRDYGLPNPIINDYQNDDVWTPVNDESW